MGRNNGDREDDTPAGDADGFHRTGAAPDSGNKAPVRTVVDVSDSAQLTGGAVPPLGGSDRHERARSGPARGIRNPEAVRWHRCAQRVDLRVRDGEFSAVIGPNGAGKSTLFNCLTGVLEPDAGTVTFDGETTWRPVGARRARQVGIGRTFQRVELFGGMTVLDHLVVADRARLQTRSRARRPLHLHEADLCRDGALPTT